MSKKLTSIIMTAFHPNNTLLELTHATLANIVRYTDRQDYELIVVDPVPKFAIRDEYQVLKIDKHITPDPDPGYPPCMNLGAAVAQGDYLCFIENDIFVWEGWLDGLLWYLQEDLVDAIMPEQIPRSREDFLQLGKLSEQEALGIGGYEQGLMIMKRSAFDKVGGWDEKRQLTCWKAMYEQLDNAKLRYSSTAKVSISHVCGATFAYHFDQNKAKSYRGGYWDDNL